MTAKPVQSEDDYMFKEASYLTLFKGPHFKPWHLRFQQKYREFVDEHLMPFADEWEESGSVSMSIYKTCHQHGFFGNFYPVEYGGQLFDGKHEFDAFAAIIKEYETARIGACGINTTIWGTMHIAVPPLLHHGSEFLKEKYVKPVLSADKIMCLAVSEPGAGSDVSSLKTVAVDDPDDDGFLRVSGEKYFISNGNKANFFTTAVKYHGSIMALLIDGDFVREHHGNAGQIITSRIQTQGWRASDTAYITFKNVKVCKKNIIGDAKSGWKVFMTNFNNERFLGAAVANGLSRVCFNEAALYAKQRKTFGSPLIQHQVIRHKLVEMIRRTEATHYMLERVAYLMEYEKRCKEEMMRDGSYYGFMKYLSSLCSLCKVQATKSLEVCVREALQIFGGRGCLRNGRGRKVERIYREVRVLAIGGGSEEILMDFVSRQAKL